MKCCPWVTIKARVMALVFITLLGMGGVFALSAYYIRQSLYEARYEQTRRLVEAAVSMIDAAAAFGWVKGVPVDQVKQEVINHLREMRYDEKEYFWINDMDSFFVMHPFPELNNTSAKEFRDAAGKNIIPDMVEIVQRKGEGRYMYYWPPAKPALKVSYVKGYPEWGWVIGSGIHVEDINRQVVEVEKRLGLAAFIIAIIAFALAYVVGRSVSTPIVELNGIMRRLAEGELNIEVPGAQRKDEVGSMAHTIQVFLENARRISLLETEQKDTENMKGEFVSVVSHELRTPLTSIRGSLGLIASGAAGTLPEKAKYLIGIAHNNCERLILLINDILDIDKIAAGNMKMDMKIEKLNRLVQQCIESNKSYADKYFVRFNFVPLDQDVSIRVDAMRFQQVLANFLSNAAKFSLGGSHIDVAVSSRNGWARISVKDYGMGIPDEFRARIFKKFSQADSSATRKKSGTGLGLYISKQLTEQMGGRVGYESKIGFGSVFWVDFKIEESEEIAPTVVKVEEMPRLPPIPLPAGQLPTILHIEPDDSFSECMAALFHRKATFLQFKTIKQAGDYLTEHVSALSHTVVLLDLNVRDVESGAEFAAYAKGHDIPVVILSTRDPSAELANNVWGILTKSRVSDETIVNTVMMALNVT